MSEGKEPTKKRLGSVRFAARLQLEIPGFDALRIFLTRNLTAEGISLKTRRALDDGRTVALTIFDENKTTLFEARATVLKTDTEGDDLPRVFLEFTELTIAGKSLLRELIEKTRADLDPHGFERVPTPHMSWESVTETGIVLPAADDPSLPATKEEPGPDLGDLLEAAARGEVEHGPTQKTDSTPTVPAIGKAPPTHAPQRLVAPPPPKFEENLPETDLILGIDLGTTFTCGSILMDGKPDIVKVEGGHRVIPSVVSVRGDQIVVGWGALDTLATHGHNTIYGSKRMLGRRYESPAVQDALHYFNYDIVPDMGYGTLASEAAVLIDGNIYPLEWVAMRILYELVVWARNHTQKMVRRAVIGVPAYYNDHQRQAVMRAGEMAGLKVERIVNEPTAAALAFGVDRGMQQKIMVYDLGGGTFDVSVLELNGNVFDVLATGGDPYLGGVDFDNRIVDWVIRKFREDQQIDLSDDPVVKLRIRQAAEGAKKELSEKNQSRIFLPFVAKRGDEGVDLDYTITREEFNHLVEDMVDRTIEVCRETLDDIGLDPKDIDELLLVGGQTRTPLVQGKVRAFVGSAPRKGVHPDEAVAIGAALLGDSLERIDSVTLLDVVSMPIGVALPGGRFRAVITRNTSLPAQKSFKISTGRDNQKSMAVDVYQGADDWIENNEYLGTAAILDLPPAKKGELTVEFTFQMDAQGFLNVSVSDSARRSKQVIEMLTLDTPESLREMVEQAPIPVEVEIEDLREEKKAKKGKKGFLNKLLKRS